MKKAILVALLLCVASTAMADYKVVGQIVYPSATRWMLYITEIDNSTGLPGGLGFSGIVINIYGASKNAAGTSIGVGGPVFGSSTAVTAYDADNDLWANYSNAGWANNSFYDANGFVQVSFGQDLLKPAALIYGIGAGPATYTAPAGYAVGGVEGGSVNYAGPVAIKTDANVSSDANVAFNAGVPGLRLFYGYRAAGQEITVNSDPAKRQANIFVDQQGGVQGMEVQFVPEPATMILLGLGALAALRRRR